MLNTSLCIISRYSDLMIEEPLIVQKVYVIICVAPVSI